MSAKPAITNPVMRFIGVADRERAITFYRDVLGFEIKQQDDGTAVEYGPVRIQFAESDFEPEDFDHPLPIGSAALFFETSDLEAMRNLICARGGNPGTIAKVNWIKFRMFEVRDPDGHKLWFGQTYNREDCAPKVGQLQQALPEMPFDNVAAAVAYYRDILGFGINYQQDDLGVMFRDKITILLISRTEKHKGIGSFEVYIENADALYEELRAKGANLLSKPTSRPWGLRDFAVEDLEGNHITFAQTFE